MSCSIYAKIMKNLDQVDGRVGIGWTTMPKEGLVERAGQPNRLVHEVIAIL